MEALSWKGQAAVASLMAVLVGYLVRLLVIDFAPLSPSAPFVVALFAILAAFVLPLVWWRTTVGYAGAAVFGILALVFQVIAIPSLPEVSYIITIPHLVFALLLIGSSALALRKA